jgi:signal transduction histidine kinase
MERAKTAWFLGAAHDIRTPLTLVAGPLEDTLATALTPEQRSCLVLAQRNVARIQRLITSLLDFSRIEAGKLSGRFVPIDLGRFVGDLAALFRPAAERRQITFNVELDPSESSVYIDPLLLETLVTNLLSNALKYTEHGNITVRLAYGFPADIDVSALGAASRLASSRRSRTGFIEPPRRWRMKSRARV